MSDEKLLEVDDLEIILKSEKKKIISGVSFYVNKGETLGIIGESGSGKSMTGKCIMRLLNPGIFKATGSVKWKGREMLGTGMSKLQGYRGRQVGLIPQNPMTAFAPMIKIGKQLEMGAGIKGRGQREDFYRRLSSALESLNLDDVEKIKRSYSSELSGGMLQRVMIAMTLVQTPELLIADEATTAVDASSEYMILKELEALREKGLSMIIVTHDFGVAARLCDRAAVMKEGKIIESGSVKKVLGEPEHEYTKSLVRACEELRCIK